ncbi:MAG: hypothetical protein AAF579_00980 [Cyanobacteria bacterium P01_C01_bin.118]
MTSANPTETQFDIPSYGHLSRIKLNQLFLVVNIVNSRLSQAQVLYKRQASSSSNSSPTIESYLIRAQEFAQQQDFRRAIFELREAIKAYPDSPLCHSTLSVLYFQANQNTMAGVHAKRTLALDPTNQLAKRIQQKLIKHAPDHTRRQQIRQAAKEGRLRSLFTKKLF